MAPINCWNASKEGQEVKDYKHSAQTKLILTVEIVINGSADTSEVVEDLRCIFDHPAVVSQAIVAWEDSP